MGTGMEWWGWDHQDSRRWHHHDNVKLTPLYLYWCKGEGSATALEELFGTEPEHCCSTLLRPDKVVAQWSSFIMVLILTYFATSSWILWKKRELLSSVEVKFILSPRSVLTCLSCKGESITYRWRQNTFKQSPHINLNQTPGSSPIWPCPCLRLQPEWAWGIASMNF